MFSALNTMKGMAASLPVDALSSKATAATAVTALFAYYGLSTANNSLQDRRVTERRRLPRYVVDEDDPVKTGLKPSEWETEVESPRKSLPGNDVDELLFSGIDNRNKNAITIKMTRLHTKYTEVYMLVTLKHNHTFSTFALPVNKFLPGQCRTNQKNHWRAGDLNIWCTLPNRSYRICFNGLLKNVESGEMQHVNFSLRWTTFTEFLDFYQYAHKENEDFMNQYEHYGCFRGTYRIDGSQDVEMALWGVRNRKLTRPREEGKCHRLYLYTKNGTAIGITHYASGDSKKSVLVGSLMASKSVIYCIEFDHGAKDSIMDLEGVGMAKLKFKTDSCTYEMHVSVEKQESLNGRTTIHPAKCVLKNLSHNWEYSGKGIFESEETDMNDFDSCSCNVREEDPQPCKEEAEDEALVGGKAVSLTALMNISRQVGFEVPRASFVTTQTFKHHLEKHPRLNRLIQSLNSTHHGKTLDLEEKSKQIYELMMSSVVHAKTKSEIESKLLSMFGDSFENKLFSVRSSAVGEDGAEMSNAGQMDTFLGVKGIDKIVESIKKCWASCFSLRALQYRRQYGQLLTADMGVVIQEMVDAESAGVMFTREPVSGHPSVIMITSNKGLGESVVSGTCQPDTIKLMKNYEDNSLSILEYDVGTKTSQIYLQGDGGIYETEGEDASEKSISETMALSLGRIGVKIEELMFEPKDIEWAIKGDTIYLLQARPITTLNLETDYDILHELDTPLVTDHEVVNAGNVKEVFSEVVSPLGLTHGFSLMTSNAATAMGQIMSPENLKIASNPYKSSFMATSHGHVFMQRTDNFSLSLNHESQKLMDLAMNGRLLDDDHVIKECRERFHGHREYAISNIPAVIWLYFNFDNYAKQLEQLVVDDTELNTCKTMEDIFSYVSKVSVGYNSMFYHILFSFSSSQANLELMKELLRNTTMENANWEDVTSDLAKLLESCGEENTVESVDIPHAIQELVKAISEAIDPEKYANMSGKEALDFLTADDSPLKSKYDAFMERHGHRGVNELEVHAEVWELFPIHLIKSTQTMMRSCNKMKNRNVPSLEESVNKLKSNISESRKKTLIKLVKKARHCVGCREQSKAKWTKSIHMYRKAFIRLADMMVDAGMLPDQRLIFFFTFHELEEFMSTRCPRIMQRVMRRKRLHNYAQTLLFPEIISGVVQPLKPKILENTGEVKLELKGIPVCHGITTAKARVCKTLRDAHEMQSGEVLVARATDVAWSPYFPIASGVITELGGLISHGAVVAREYGLPCIIDVVDATSLISTGDVITLNGSTGTVSRVSKAAIQE